MGAFGCGDGAVGGASAGGAAEGADGQVAGVGDTDVDGGGGLIRESGDRCLEGVAIDNDAACRNSCGGGSHNSCGGGTFSNSPGACIKYGGGC